MSAIRKMRLDSGWSKKRVKQLQERELQVFRWIQERKKQWISATVAYSLIVVASVTAEERLGKAVEDGEDLNVFARYC